MNVEQILQAFNALAEEQGWAQHHTPKNLAIAVSTEASELLLEFQWQQQDDDLTEQQRERIAAEIADVQMYLIKLSSSLGIDLEKAVQHKIAVNQERLR